MAGSISLDTMILNLLRSTEVIDDEWHQAALQFLEENEYEECQEASFVPTAA